MVMFSHSIFTVAVATLLIDSVHITYAEVDPWSYLSVKLPTTLSDMAITHMTYGNSSATDASIDGMATTDTDDVIILTGGCSSEYGNQFIENGEDEIFACTQLSKKTFAFKPIAPKTHFQAWSGDFIALSDMPRERARHVSFEAWDGSVCVIGGRDITDTLIAEIDCYDKNTDNWSTIGKLPEEYLTSDAAGFAMGNSAYLIGGYGTSYEAMDKVTVIDISNLNDIKFFSGPPLGTKRGSIDVAVLDNSMIYVSGGFTHNHDYSKPLNTVEQLTIGTSIWIPVNALNEERGGKQLVTLKGNIYALGGERRVDVSGIAKEELLDLVGKGEVLDTVEMLSPHEDVHGGKSEWRVIGTMPSSLVRFAASSFDFGDDDGVVFVFGGQTTYDADCECFRNSDRVMVFDASRAFDTEESNASGITYTVNDFVAYCMALSVIGSLI